MTEAVRLLDRRPFSHAHSPASTKVNRSLRSPDLSDPFSAPTSAYTYSTTGSDTYPAPSAYPSRQHSWVHIFPEGKIHQHPNKVMRYFKWGVARLILEPEMCPDIIPIWIDGTQHVMHESRGFPRFLPRPGSHISVLFGGNVGGEATDDNATVFHELRQRWQQLVERYEKSLGDGTAVISMGVLSDELKYGDEAVRLREECTRQVRNEVLKVRRMTGLPDEDPKWGLVQTSREEGDSSSDSSRSSGVGHAEGRMEDGSWVKDT